MKRLIGKRSGYIGFIALLIGVVVVAALLSAGVGHYSITAMELWQVLVAGPGAGTAEAAVLFNIRLPRIFAALLIGAALAASGAVYQSVVHNPLASPDVLGVTSGAGLGASIALFLGLPHGVVQLMAFAFGMGVVGLTMLIARLVGAGRTLGLVLTGTMLGTLCTSLISLIKYMADPHDRLPTITYWLMGSLAKLRVEDLWFSLPFMVVGLFLVWMVRWRCNLLAFGTAEARGMGIRPGRTRLVAVTGATLLAAAAVCIAGQVGWVGLMVPHLARRVVGPDLRRVIPASLLMGGLFLLVVDDICRAAFAVELPLGVVTAVIGLPCFLILFIRGAKGGHHA